MIIICFRGGLFNNCYIQIVSIVFCISCQLIFTERVPSGTWYVNRLLLTKTLFLIFFILCIMAVPLKCILIKPRPTAFCLALSLERLSCYSLWHGVTSDR